MRKPSIAKLPLDHQAATECSMPANKDLLRLKTLVQSNGRRPTALRSHLAKVTLRIDVDVRTKVDEQAEASSSNFSWRSQEKDVRYRTG